MDVKSFANKAMFELKKQSPTIAIVSGIGTGIFATYLACKATLKVDAILDEANKKIADIHRVADDPVFKQDHPELAAQYTEDNKIRDLVIVYGQTIWGLTKLYWPALAAGTASIALIVGSHRAMMKRVAALGATVTILGGSLNRYRAQIRELYGEEKERDIYFGLSNEKIDEIVVDEETGKGSKQKVTVKAADEEKIISPYSRLFDSSNPNYVKDDVVFNVDFLKNVQDALKRQTRKNGWMFLNTALMAYGFKPVPEGQVLGWIYDSKDPNAEDKIIDIGIDHISRQDVRDFRNGCEKVFLIDFENVQPIIETFHIFDRSNTI